MDRSFGDFGISEQVRRAYDERRSLEAADGSQRGALERAVAEQRQLSLSRQGQLQSILDGAVRQRAELDAVVGGGMSDAMSRALSSLNAQMGDAVRGPRGSNAESAAHVTESLRGPQSALAEAVRRINETLRGSRSVFAEAVARMNENLLGPQYALSEAVARMHESMDAAMGQRTATAIEEALYRQSRSIAEGLRLATSLSAIPAEAYLRTAGLTAGSLEPAISGSLGAWYSAFDGSLVERLESELRESVAEEPEASLVSAIAIAVVRTVEGIPDKADWRFVTTLVIALLIFLVQEVESNANGAELDEKIQLIQKQLEAQTEFIKLLLTREVRRDAALRTRPSGRAPKIAVIPQGTSVIEFERRGKWTRVGVRLDDSPTGTAMRGWVLNKYLRAAR